MKEQVPDQARWALVVGGWDDGPGYPRYAGLRNGLEAMGCHPVERRMQVPWLGRGKRRPWRWAWQLPAIRRRFRSLLHGWLVSGPKPDFVLLPYPGHLLVEDARSVAAPLGVPVVLDLFLSLRGTLVEDRGWFPKGGWIDRSLTARDRAACSAADLVLLDTEEHAEITSNSVGLERSRFHAIPVVDPDPPGAALPWPSNPASPLRLLAIGTGIPLHGLSTLLEAVRMVDGIELTVIGGDRRNRGRAPQMLSGRLRMLPRWVGPEVVQAELERCQVVAGIFGTSCKAQSVVPFKLVHALAAGRAVITSDTAPQRRLLGEGDGPAGWMCPPGDIDALADCLRAAVAESSSGGQVLRTRGHGARAIHDRALSTQSVADAWRSALAHRLGAPAAEGPHAGDRPVQLIAGSATAVEGVGG